MKRIKSSVAEKLDKNKEINAKHDEMLRKKAITNLHYRKIWEDELETKKDIFFEETFTNIDIKRGQQRGNSKSWFSTDIEDESG